MNRRIYILVMILTVLLVPVSLQAADIQIDLNGFRLLQFKAIVENTFGKPFKTFKTDYSIIEAHRIDSNAYMVFEYDSKMPNNIFSIQLTGHTNKVLPFKGLTLGDDVKKVIDILGKPSEIKEIESPKVSACTYEGTNYSVEIDDKGKLYSVRIYSTKEVYREAKDSFKSYGEFKALIIAKNIKGIIEMLRPDVEIYKNGKSLYINKRYADFVSNPDKEFIEALLGERESVLREVTTTEPEGAIRIHEKVGVGEVYKFNKGQILTEIYFLPYNGKHRVYEINFREKNN
ncbi:MAG: hypothetical protein JW914_09740 [Syntrophaceae bacterium]|nr:hypothetical protein [Syntrophaceae bacterium]